MNSEENLRGTNGFTCRCALFWGQVHQRSKQLSTTILWYADRRNSIQLCTNIILGFTLCILLVLGFVYGYGPLYNHKKSCSNMLSSRRSLNLVLLFGLWQKRSHQIKINQYTITSILLSLLPPTPVDAPHVIHLNFPSVPISHLPQIVIPFVNPPLKHLD